MMMMAEQVESSESQSDEAGQAVDLQQLSNALLPNTSFQGMIFTSLDGTPLSIQPGSQVIPISSPSNMNTEGFCTASFGLEPGTDRGGMFIKIPQELSSMLATTAVFSDDTEGRSASTGDYDGGAPRSVEYETLEIIDLEEYETTVAFKQSKAVNRTRGLSNQKGIPQKNPLVSLRISDNESVTLQKYYYPGGLCRVCLLEKENSMHSIFQDVTIDDHGDVENARGRHAGQYFYIIPALKTLLDVDVQYGDGLPDQICMECLDNLYAFSAFRKRIAIGQAKLEEITVQVKDSSHPTFLPSLGEKDFQKTDVFKFPESIVLAKEILSTSEFSHLVQRKISDRTWDTIFSAMSQMVGLKSEKLKPIQNIAFSKPYVTGWFCTVCELTFHDTKDAFVKHLMETHKLKLLGDALLPCDICGESFPIVDSSGIRQNYGEHWLQHFFFHECDVCSKRLPSHKGLWTHKKSAHSKKEKTFCCLICDKSFAKASYLESHKKTHMSAAEREQHMFQCNVCNKRLTGNLASHMAAIHSKNRPWKCEICQKTFKRKEILLSHRNLVHLNLKNFQCEICGETFKSHSTKAVHLLRHRGDKPHECVICNKRFFTLHTLKSHELKHKTSGDIECPECHKVFKRKVYLTEHLRLHTGLKPHECSICGKLIRMKSNLYKHLKVHQRKAESAKKVAVKADATTTTYEQVQANSIDLSDPS